MSLLLEALQKLKNKKVAISGTEPGFVIKRSGVGLNNHTIVSVDESGFKTDKGMVYALTAIAAIEELEP